MELITVHLKYLRYVLLHKWFVFLECCKRGIIWRGLVHDWTKFQPCEWFPYARFFYGKGHQESFDIAWNHHQKRNDHHWQYWLLKNDSGETKILPMPDQCRREMLSDWIGAGKALGKPDTKEWYKKNAFTIKLHPDTRQWIEDQLCPGEWASPPMVGQLVGIYVDKVAYVGKIITAVSGELEKDSHFEVAFKQDGEMRRYWFSIHEITRIKLDAAVASIANLLATLEQVKASNYPLEIVMRE